MSVMTSLVKNLVSGDKPEILQKATYTKFVTGG